jgi:peptidoglycan/xylan/chitin deacetylase (PgdA/CDA1 family)
MFICLMYHYVHSENDDRIFKNLKGLTTNEFKYQIEYMLKHFKPITHQDLLNFFNNKKPLPKKSFYLTFDDGFKQHYTNVLPILKEYGLTGSFFVPTIPLSDNKIHFLEKQRVSQYCIVDTYEEFLELFYENSKNLLDKKKLSLIEPNQTNIKNSKDFLKECSYYTNEERFFRKIRNSILTKSEIENIINKIFESNFDNTFINRYYMNINNLKEMHSKDMIIGGHSHTHPYLEYLNKIELEDEITTSFNFLRNNINQTINSFSYPFGTYNQNVLDYVKSINLDYAFTTKDKINSDSIKKYEIKRVDASLFSRIFNV